MKDQELGSRHSVAVSDPRRETRLLVADDHTLVAEAYKKLLEPEFEVVGVVADGSMPCRV